jgi:polyisoprenoid-binding protein YceI
MGSTGRFQEKRRPPGMKWIIDPDHSMAVFSVSHMMIANVWGQITKVTGTMDFDPANPSGASVEVKLDLHSLTTGIKKRDEHLLSPDFFEAEKFPEIHFKSRSVDSMQGNRGRISGDLTIRGVTRPVSLEVEYTGPVKSPDDLGGEVTLGFTATTVIDRTDFGVNWNMPLDKGGLMVGNSVRITIEIEADLSE